MKPVATPSVLLIACGAIAKEIIQLQTLNGWQHIKIQCLPAELHNRPEKIPTAVRSVIEEQGAAFDKIFVAYADCGTGGMLDKMLAEFSIERLPGTHCYDFFAGSDVFQALAEAEPGTFYVTDFLVQHFDRLVKKGLGLEQHPELKSVYFENYHRLVYLSQSHSPELEAMAKQQARYLGLEYHHSHTGLTHIEQQLKEYIIL